MSRTRICLIAACLTVPLGFCASAASAWTGDPTTQPSLGVSGSSSAPIDQGKIDAAMAKMRERQASRPAPATQPATQPSTAAAIDPPDYPRDLVTARKLEMLHQYDQDLAAARQALRRHELAASDVRDLLNEQSTLQQLPMEKFRELLMEADARNARRIERYRAAFGELEHAAATVVTILMKSGLIDSAQPLPDDPLSQDLEESHGVRRVYFHFLLPSHDSSGVTRRHNGFVEFQLATEQGLWLPTWADLEGDPIPLFDLEAFVPLRPFQIVYDGMGFIVAQETSLGISPPQIFSLLTLHSAGESARRNAGYRPGASASSRP